MGDGMVLFVTVNNLHGLVCIPRKRVYVMRTPSLIYILHNDNYTSYTTHWGTAVAQWLRCCATNRKVAGSIPAGVRKSFRLYYVPGFDSASNRNDYQEYFLGIKAAGA